MAERKSPQKPSWTAAGTTTLKSRTESTREVTADFVLRAPQARQVSVAGTFNNWNTNSSKLTKDFRGNWTGSVRLQPGRYEYRFFVDGNWADDPKARTTTPNQFGSQNAILEIK